MALRVKEILNMGECPKCLEHTHFNRTFQPRIFTCAICDELVEQKMNGKVLYKEVSLPGMFINKF